MMTFKEFLAEEGKKPWDKKNPEADEKNHLSPKQKAAAKRRAKNAGRRYPNQVDNMWAANQ